MTSGRKEAIRAYKERKTRRGIFSVRCAATGEVWVGSAPNLDTIQNRIWFFLRHGQHRNMSIQAAWDVYGEQSFQFAIVEELDEDIPALVLNDTLKKRQNYWVTELGASTVT